MSNVAVLNKTACIRLTVSMWTGQARLKPEDFGAMAKALPPKDLASLGSLKLVDPERIHELNNLKRAAERVCSSLCCRFLGGYATDEDLVPKLTSQLDVVAKEFEEKAKALVDALPNEVAAWKSKQIANHPQWAAAIERAAPDAAYVAKQLQFKYQLFRVAAVSEDPTAAVNTGLGEVVAGLSGQLLCEIEADAQDAWERSYTDRVEVTQKALRPVAAIRRKLEALQYLDVRIRPLIQHIDTVLSTMPRRGIIKEPHLTAVTGLLSLLRDADAMRCFAEAALASGPVLQPALTTLQEDAGDLQELLDIDEDGSEEDLVSIAPRPRVEPTMVPSSGFSF